MTQQPNILIFMTDHQRGDTVLPEHPALTPHLTAFAREGVTFTRTYCPSPHCCPARATFFSGLYPSGHGVWNNVCNEQALHRGLREGVRLWSEDLADVGYRQYYIGKWHVSAEESPRDRGWTELFVSAVPGDRHGGDWEYYRMMAERSVSAPRGDGEILRPGYGDYHLYGELPDAGNRHDDRVVVDACRLLPELANGAAPWVVFAGAIGPHDPYVVPPRYRDRYDLDAVPLPPSFADTLADKPRIYQRMRRQIWDQLSEREIREGIRHFWAYCSYLDEQFGQVLAALEQSGQAENTLVLYCADHGDYCGEHGLFCKGIPCFHGAYHVPAIVRWPRGISDPGRREDAFVSLADFAPTFLEVAGAPARQRYTGASLLPFLRNTPPPAWRDEMHTQCNGVELYFTQRSVMTADCKYVFNGFDFDELYDRRHDPHEMHNLADDPAYAEVKREMVGRLWRFASREGDTAINQYITVGLAPFGPAEAFRTPHAPTPG